MVVQRRRLAASTAAGVLAVTAWATAGCADQKVNDFEEAVTACIAAVRPKGSADEQTDLSSWHSHVTRQGTNWQVEGKLPSTGRDVTCRVVPDPSNQLRGMRVDSIRLSPARSG